MKILINHAIIQKLILIELIHEKHRICHGIWNYLGIKNTIIKIGNY